MSQPSTIRRNSLPNLVQIDDTCIVDNRGNTVNLGKLIEDTVENPSLPEIIGPSIIQAVRPLIDNVVQSALKPLKDTIVANLKLTH